MKKFFKKQLRNRKGQSAIEFIVVVVVILFFLLFFLSLSILLVVSDYLEFATFMSARTYKSMFSSQDAQENNARQVFNSYASRVQGIARDINLEFLDGGDGGPQAAGVRARYTIDLFYLPPLFIPDGIPASGITLSTETRLGRDSSYQECNNYFRTWSRRLGLNLEGTRLINLMDDNGC